MSAPLMYDSDIAPVAALLADRTRAAMLTALLDGRPLAAGELAATAGVGAATASSHLARLLDGGLVTVVRQGRHRYYRLSGTDVAAVIEALSRLGEPVTVRGLRRSRQARALQVARSCYDHLAGRAGTALFTALLDGGLLDVVEACYDDPARSVYEVTAKGERVFADIGVDVASARRSRRKFAGHCLDWTERRPHLGGALGAAVTARLIEDDWFRRGASRRALVLTEHGRRGLADAFGCIVDECDAS